MAKQKSEVAKQESSVTKGYSTIEVEGVSKSFGTRSAVTDLTFKIGSGEVVGFLGPNGAGKSTTMRLLSSFYTQDNGSILINGVDTQDESTITRRSIGYLPENNPLYGDLLVQEYLSFVADLRGMSRSERASNLDDTIEQTGLQEVYYRPINQLSKGYRQRVGLAQAILHKPSILIMDEPTEGLDPNQRLTMRELIRSLGQDRTVLLSTHVMQEVETTCERVLLISRGKLVADSSVEDLLLRARGQRSIHVEVEGNGVETALRGLPNIDHVDHLSPVDDRKRYVVYVSTGADLRPEIFALAKEKEWILWELHEDRARLEDVFYSLTVQEDQEG